jgi:hypothetical protein
MHHFNASDRTADTPESFGGVPDMEAMVPKLLIRQNLRRRISTSGTPPRKEQHRKGKER